MNVSSIKISVLNAEINEKLEFEIIILYKIIFIIIFKKYYQNF